VVSATGVPGALGVPGERGDACDAELVGGVVEEQALEQRRPGRKSMTEQLVAE